MATPVVMPQMGESVAEGTIVRWIKKVGDQVDRDEPLLEISTDKVDAEIPAPVAGVLTEIRAAEGETVPVDSVVGMIESASTRQAAVSGAAATRQTAAPAEAAPRQDPHTPVPSTASTDPGTARDEDEEGDHQRISPVVRRMAKEHNVDLSQIQGTGAGGRVTKQDILRHLEAPAIEQGAGAGAGGKGVPVHRADERVEIQPLSIMRKKIAEHMVLSKRTSAHVHSVFHVSFARVEQIRERKKQEYERRGVKLTYMAFIARAITEALGRHPLVNASLDGTNIVFKKDVNLGIAVAIEGGLIVPVIPRAGEQTMEGLCRAIADVANRARAKQLKPDEVHGGTFTITNPGQFGAQFGMPIINQPQVAILGVGTIEKRPVVIEDAIAVRLMAYLTLGYDHRLIDGATADQFMADVKQRLEEFDEGAV